MREFKFRAWDSYFKSFTGFIIEKDKNNEDRIFFKKANHYSDYYLGENKTRFFLMQYTGLKDKNGVDIYEGDIIKVNGNLYEVWHSGLAFGLIDKNKDFFEYMCQLCDMNGKVYEIIGNIYENPELLKDNK